MSSLTFTKAELTSAIARGVRQCVIIGSKPFREPFRNGLLDGLDLFTVDESQQPDSEGAFVQTEFESEALSSALAKSDFDNLKASLFVWLGDAGYRSAEAAMATLAFIASLPQGSGIIFDYAERSYRESLHHGALDALASRMVTAGGSVKHLIQPQAVGALLRSLGFKQIVDSLEEDLAAGGEHLVSASV